MVKSERQKLELGFDNSWIIEISTQKYSPVKILIQVTIETGSLEVEEGYSLIKKMYMKEENKKYLVRSIRK